MQKYVVLKKIHNSILDKTDIRAELNILKNLRHSYLPSVLDFIESEGSIYTVMDYISGSSMQDILDNGGTFTQAQVIKYSGQLSEVLCYLQGQKIPIIHGDIKPANIMITPEDNICLIDFNISQVQGNISIENVGYTPGFAAPELVEAFEKAKASRKESVRTVLLSEQTVLLSQNEEKKEDKGTVLLSPNESERTVLLPREEAELTLTLDARADIYAVGATLYTLICGQEPSENFSDITPIGSITDNCSEGLRRVIEKCMACNPKQRFQSAQELSKAIAGIGKADKRYRRLLRRQEVSICICILGIAASVILCNFGVQRLQREKIERYEKNIVELEKIRTGESEQDFEQIYEEAVAEFPLYPGAYYQNALRLYDEKDYTELVTFIQDEALYDPSEFSNSDLGEFYFLLASAYMELDDLENAINNYRLAIQYDAEESEYYSDYAIALGQNGDLENAEAILVKAEELGFDTDHVLLARAEISGLSGEAETAADYFAECIRVTDDSYVLLRAYILWSELYVDGSENALTEQIRILSEGASKVSADDQAVILERLAQAQIDLGSLAEDNSYFEEALASLQQITDLGWDTYVTHSNIGILYEKVENYDAAKSTYEDMLIQYGEDYRTYKRLAFLEIEIQAQKPNASREYETFLEYYNQAQTLFADSGVRADSDMEMQLLDQAYQQLQDGNWF
jgi:serine/threonine-protein kinase